MEIELPQDFKEFLRLLDANGVLYLLIGGYAVSFYGYPRATKDMDLWIEVQTDNAERMVRVLREFGFDLPELSTALFLKPDSIVRLGIPPMCIEVGTTISGVFFADCYASRVTETIDGIPVQIIGLPQLKANKKASGRHRDLDDLEHLP